MKYFKNIRGFKRKTFIFVAEYINTYHHYHHRLL